VNARVPTSIAEPLREHLAARRVVRVEPSGKDAPASVLVPLVDRGGETHLWLIRRPEKMRRHAGQVALPGGKVDPVDVDAKATALRETEEELGFPAKLIDVHGRLDDLNTTTGFVISPFVGWLREDRAPVPNEAEIARAFCVPLAIFAFTEPRPRPFRGQGWTRIAPSYEVDGEIVWGATAKILGDLGKIVREILG
jgi:8-oxo-dGTP pyrophosphatase MutT (NUDIX family)